MVWLAIEDADTHEVSEFEMVSEEEVLYLMRGYRVDTCNPTRVRVQDVEDGHNIVYEGVTYRGGYGYNLWVARKYMEV